MHNFHSLLHVTVLPSNYSFLVLLENRFISYFGYEIYMFEIVISLSDNYAYSDPIGN